jgi:hydrogenase nickel incorporation protein HypA/HybF
MHEFGIIRNIVNILEQEGEKNNFKKITRFTLRLGKLRQCLPDFMHFAFKIIAKNSVAENAEMIILSGKTDELILETIEGE